MNLPSQFPFHMNPLFKAALALLFALVLGIAWWLAGLDDASSSTSKQVSIPRDRGPVEAAFCGPLQPPRAAPPIDSPFGIHLYASTPKGTVTPLPVMEIVNQLAPPESTTKDKPAAPGQNETAYDDVQTVNTLLEEYLRAFGAMPVGELNDEIVRRLQGENPKGIAVLPKSHPSINAEGELVDRWGTPYRFHPESAWHMTVRSAGPDKKMWTGDDQISQDETKAVTVEL